MTTTAFLMIPETLCQVDNISNTVKNLLVRLERHINLKTGQCNPRINTLARELGVNEKTIDRTLAKLRKFGLVSSRKGQRGCSYLIAPREQWVSILQGHSVPTEPVPAGTECPCTQGQNVPADPPHPLSEDKQGKRGRSGREAAAAAAPHFQNFSTPTHRSGGYSRKPPAMSPTLIAYYERYGRQA